MPIALTDDHRALGRRRPLLRGVREAVARPTGNCSSPAATYPAYWAKAADSAGPACISTRSTAARAPACPSSRSSSTSSARPPRPARTSRPLSAPRSLPTAGRTRRTAARPRGRPGDCRVRAGAGRDGGRRRADRRGPRPGRGLGEHLLLAVGADVFVLDSDAAGVGVAAPHGAFDPALGVARCSCPARVPSAGLTAPRAPSASHARSSPPRRPAGRAPHCRWRWRTRRCASSSAGPSARSRRSSTTSRTCWSRPSARRRSAWDAAARPTTDGAEQRAGRRGRCVRRAARYVHNAQTEHPDPRRHRLHVGARRPPVPAPRAHAGRRVRRRRGRRRLPQRPPPACGAPRESNCRPRPSSIAVAGARVSSRVRPRLPTRAARHCSSTRATSCRTGRSRSAAPPDRSSNSSSTRSSPASTCPALGIGGWVLLTHRPAGDREQVERWIPPSLRGEHMWCQLFSEPGAGSDAAAVQTKAVRVDGGWLINGQKVWTSGAQHCDRGLATVRTDPDVPKHRGITDCRRRHARRRASTSGRCARSPAARSSTRCSSTTCSCPTTTSSARSTPAGRSLAPRSATSGSRSAVGRWATRLHSTCWT